MVAGIAVAVYGARRHPGAWLVWFERGLAAVILAGWAGEYVADVIQGTYSTRYTLPLQLTDVISLTAVFALLTRRRLAIELVYFWAFTATLQAVLTPDLAVTFPNVLYFTYFMYHVGAIVAAALLVFGLREYPRPRAAWRTFGATLGWAVVAGIGDVIFDGNYMYLRYKPAHNSLLSVLGPWPWYIAGAAAIGLAMLLVLAAITEGIRRIDPLLPASAKGSCGP
jgi:hypothetical integral membrane protein (TIGR02206 family)